MVLFIAARRVPRRRRRRSQRQLDSSQLASHRPHGARHSLLRAPDRRRRSQHHLSGPRGPPQRAPRRLSQRRHPRAEDAHRLHPPLPRNPAAPAARRARSAASSTRACSPTATACWPPSSRCSRPAKSGQRSRSHVRVSVDMRALVEDCIRITLLRHHLDEKAITLAGRGNPRCPCWCAAIPTSCRPPC